MLVNGKFRVEASGYSGSYQEQNRVLTSTDCEASRGSLQYRNNRSRKLSRTITGNIINRLILT